MIAPPFSRDRFPLAAAAFDMTDRKRDLFTGYLHSKGKLAGPLAACAYAEVLKEQSDGRRAP